MRELYLLEVLQHDKKRYVGVAPARDLVRLATTVELKETQEAQRPINPKRLSEIAQFVSSNGGILSTSIVIGTKNDNLSVEPADIKGIDNLYKMKFPETEAEFEKFKDSFDIMDGQHRLFSFLSDDYALTDAEDFDITFEMYIKPTLRERRLIFKNTNEKQEKVASNLLMWFRAKLDMLNEKEQTYHQVVSLLNSESCSPLKGRIIMGAERVVGGLKAEQIITVLSKSDVKNIASPALSDEKMLALLSEYLLGWESAVGSKIADRDKDVGAFSKIAGLRFMMLMLPTFYDQATSEKEKFNKKYVESKLNTLFASEGLEAHDIFCSGSDYFKSLGSNPFASETTTKMQATLWSSKLKALSAGTFDPLS